MTAQLLDGNAFLESVKRDLAERVKKLGDRGITPGLGTILVGDDESSAVYVRLKHQNSGEIGIASFGRELPATTTQDELFVVIREYNENPEIDAFLVQLPLPKHLDEEETLRAVDPGKDVDGLHPVNLGKLVMGVDAPLACTPAGIQALLVHYGVPIEGRHVVIVGRGLNVGRPLANLLSLKRPNANAAVTVVHTGVADWPEYTRRAEIVVAAAGVPGILKPEHITPGATVVGGGVRYEGRKLLPDVDERCNEVAGRITPRVGGVGPTTIAMLFRNAVDAAERRTSR